MVQWALPRMALAQCCFSGKCDIISKTPIEANVSGCGHTKRKNVTKRREKNVGYDGQHFFKAFFMVFDFSDPKKKNVQNESARNL